MVDKRKEPKPYTRDNADLDKIVHRKYLLDVYGVVPLDRKIDLGPKPVKEEIYGKMNLKSEGKLEREY